MPELLHCFSAAHCQRLTCAWVSVISVSSRCFPGLLYIWNLKFQVMFFLIIVSFSSILILFLHLYLLSESIIISSPITAYLPIYQVYIVFLSSLHLVNQDFKHTVLSSLLPFVLLMHPLQNFLIYAQSSFSVQTSPYQINLLQILCLKLCFAHSFS